MGTPAQPPRTLADGGLPGAIAPRVPGSFDTLFEQVRNGLAHCRMIFQDGRPVDWIYLRVNAAFSETTGLVGVENKRISEVKPELLQHDPELLEIYGAVAKTREPAEFELHVRSMDMWFAVSVYSPAPDEFISVFDVVTAQKSTEAALRTSERRQRAMFEQTPVAMALFAPDGSFLQVNRKLCAILGYDPQELVGVPYSTITHPDDSEKNARSLQALVSGAVPALVTETRLVRKDGSTLWVSANTVTVEGSAPGGSLLTVVEDITVRKKAEADLRSSDAALRSSEHHLHAMFDLAPVGMVEGDPETGRLLRVNARMCAITGYSAEELIGRSFVDDLTHPDDRAETREMLRRIRGGEVREHYLEKRYVRKDGSIAWVHLNVTALPDALGETRTLATVEDLSERRRSEAELRIHTTALRAAANGIVITDPAGRIESVNPAFTALTGYPEEEVVGQSIRILSSGLQPQTFYQSLWSTIVAGGVWRGELTNRRKDGTLYDEEMTITPLYGDHGEIAHFIAIKQDVTERRRAEAALRASDERYRSLVDNLEDVIFSMDLFGEITFINRAISAFGYEPQALAGRSLKDLVHPEDRGVIGSLVRGESEQGSYELRLLDARHKVRFVRVTVRRQMAAGERVGLTGVIVDLTTRRETEEQLRAAQKMEAVGRLAGGVAHDFNNILSVILSYAELAVDDLRPGDPLRADLSEIVQAAKRAEGLTRQLLAFSRKQLLSLESVDLNELVAGLTKMLGRLIGEDVSLAIHTEEGLRRTKVDRGQIEQVIMNLIVNARDALPDGGNVGIATRNVELDLPRAQSLELAPGRYVELTIADSGCGMDDATRARIFEPFFTTKGPGKGTGLGLSMVYGIVRQSGGAIYVDSAPGQGATFHIYLPELDGEPAPRPMRALSPRTGAGNETILVVEDEAALRNVVHRVLAASGYHVWAVANAGEALLFCEKRGHEVSLVLTDVIMPGMSGSELAIRLAPLCPSAKVMFMSGYTDDALERHGVLDAELLRKPFDWRTLTQRIRSTLDAAPEVATP